MISGIYLLKFDNTTKVYVGQSVDIHRRFRDHLNSMNKGYASIKLLEAYKIYGTPKLEILLELPTNELNDAETSAIEIYNSIADGFNTVAVTTSTYSLDEDVCGAYKHPKTTYIEIARLLATTNLTNEEIASRCDSTRGIVAGISSQTSNLWLKTVCPEYYTKITEKSKFTKGSIGSMGKVYTLIGPNNEIELVDNASKFCKKYKLDNGNVSKLFSKTIKYYKGWRLQGTEPYPIFKVLSPEGIEFTIGYKGIAPFAREHNLDFSLLARLTRNEIQSHRGWKLIK